MLFLANCSISGWLKDPHQRTESLIWAATAGQAVCTCRAPTNLPAEQGWALARLQPAYQSDNFSPYISVISLWKRGRWKTTSIPDKLLQLSKNNVSTVIWRIGFWFILGFWSWKSARCWIWVLCVLPQTCSAPLARRDLFKCLGNDHPNALIPPGSGWPPYDLVNY